MQKNSITIYENIYFSFFFLLVLSEIEYSSTKFDNLSLFFPRVVIKNTIYKNNFSETLLLKAEKQSIFSHSIWHKILYKKYIE
ncbi:hypothetical protein BpHYR1_018634 [Brachionus plicatilis]|uniref:Uncharacterized protein n=1 Tax=Brachionus plicatilis TaxID=10195 RepID=A0A3M7P3R9_BRAPC|nr:hypothetical protein BpHYR1_018634 [Brachionus plicatilis]